MKLILNISCYVCDIAPLEVVANVTETIYIELGEDNRCSIVRIISIFSNIENIRCRVNTRCTSLNSYIITNGYT